MQEASVRFWRAEVDERLRDLCGPLGFLRSMKASRSAFTSSLSVAHRPCEEPLWGSRYVGRAKARPINSIIITIGQKETRV
jgi:hypothetical protein